MKGCVCDGRYDGCEHKYPCRAEVTDDRYDQRVPRGGDGDAT